LGYFRVSYSDNLWKKLEIPLKSLQLKPTDRLSLVHDAFALARASIHSMQRFLSLINIMKENENNISVWSAISANISLLLHYYSQESFFPKFCLFVQQIYQPIYKELGWDSKSEEDSLKMTLRGIIISILGKVSYKPVIDEAILRFDKFIKNENYYLHPDLRQPVFDIIISERSLEGYEAILKVFRKSDFIEQRRCVIALGKSKDNVLLQRTLNFTLSSEIRNQDISWAVQSVVVNGVYGTELAWKFFKENFSVLFGKLVPKLRIAIIDYTTSYFCSEDRAQDIEQFFKSNQITFAERIVKQNLESIRDNCKWLKNDRIELQSFFN